MSISDELMWRYYALLSSLAPAEVQAEQAKGAPMASKMALARRLASDFHGPAAGEEAEREWRRVHQQRETPSEMPVHRIPPGRHRPRQILTAAGLAASNGEANGSSARARCGGTGSASSPARIWRRPRARPSCSPWARGTTSAWRWTRGSAFDSRPGTSFRALVLDSEASAPYIVGSSRRYQRVTVTPVVPTQRRQSQARK